VEFEGIRYSHIIDPRTGWPASGLASVTIFAPKAELADALATSIFVMGRQVGLNFINQLQNIECIMVDDKGNIYKSDHIKLNTTKK
jgi:thiamine biosynthesis lipoprotein